QYPPDPTGHLVGMPGGQSAAASWHPVSHGGGLSGERKVARIGRKFKGPVARSPRFGPFGSPLSCLGRQAGLRIRRKPGRDRSLWSCKNPLPTPPNAGGARAKCSGVKKAYSCNCLLSDSTSSDSATSLATRASILRTACRTVV